MSKIKLSNNKFLSPGDTILRKDLHKYLGGSGQGGINPSSKSSSILIFTDPKEGAKHGYNDGWNKGIFEYFGSGQKGNMELKKMNKSLLNHVEEGRRLFLFNGHRGEITYENEFILYERDPYFWTISPDNEGKLRDSIVFRLKPLKKRHQKKMAFTDSTGAWMKMEKKALQEMKGETVLDNLVE